MRNDCDGFFAALGWMAFAPDPAARRPLPPCQRLVTSAEEVKQWLAALL